MVTRFSSNAHRAMMECSGHWTSFPFLLIAITVTASVAFGTDPCTDYGEINQVRRSAAAEVEAGHSLLCDNTLSQGWYRFISYVGGEIPTTCVEPYHCGTQVPIWMNGTLPTDSTVVSRTVCPNYGVPGDCCPFPWNIHVKRCVDTQGVFYVYELVPTTGCSQAYCAGTLPVCPEGEVYDQYNSVCLETRHPVPCDFEGMGICEWRQVTNDEFDWVKKKAGNEVGSLLPAVDHTIGITGGHFLYASNDGGQQPLDSARLISPVIVPSLVQPCNMTLSYYFSGPDAGNLNVFTRQYYTGVEKLTWQKSAGVTKEWTKVTVSFREQDAFQVIIQGEIGYGRNVGIAIDDISFSWDCVREVDGSVRLVDGSRFDEGRVEIYYNHRWGTICNIGWTQTSADVVCAQLGYRNSVWTDTRYPAPDSTPILLDDVTCDSRNKSRITECRTKPWENWSPLCNHGRDVSVRCVGQWHQCSADQFVCDNAVCLPSIAQCDSKDDCGDASDESDCGDQGLLTGIILAILLSIVVLVAIGVAMFLFYRGQKRAKDESNNPNSNHPLESLPVRTEQSGVNAQDLDIRIADDKEFSHGVRGRDTPMDKWQVEVDGAHAVPTSKDQFLVDSSSNASLVGNTVDMAKTANFSRDGENESSHALREENLSQNRQKIASNHDVRPVSAQSKLSRTSIPMTNVNC